MRAVREDFEAELVEFNGADNRAHLRVNFPPKVAVSRPANSLKRVSSRGLRQELPDLVRHYRRAQRLGPARTSPGRSTVSRSPS
ncbi:transposase [Streptomyces chartreusis]